MKLVVPDWFRKYVEYIQVLLMALNTVIIYATFLLPNVDGKSAALAITGLFMLHTVTVTVLPLPDWAALRASVKSWKENHPEQDEGTVITSYYSEDIYDNWKCDMLLENRETADMAVFTTPSIENKSIGFFVELIKDEGEFYLRKYCRIKRFDGNFQLCVVQWGSEDIRMKFFLQDKDLPRYKEIYGEDK